MSLGVVIVAFTALLLVIFLLANAVRIVNEYERGVIFSFGRVRGSAKGPGPFSSSRYATRWSRWI